MSNTNPVFIVNPKASYADCLIALDENLQQIQGAAYMLSNTADNQGSALSNALWLIASASEQADTLSDHLAHIGSHFFDFDVSLEAAKKLRMSDAEQEAKKGGKAQQKTLEQRLNGQNRREIA